jgi:cytochrome P450
VIDVERTGCETAVLLPAVTTDLDDLAHGNDPYPVLAGIRDRARVAMMPSGVAIVTGHAECLAVLRSPAAISGPIAARYHAALPPGAAHDELVNRINFIDPPDHPRVRGIVSKAFTPRRVAEVRPFAERTARAVADQLGSRFDVVADFAHHLPSLVISELLGIPPSDRDQLTRWSDDVTPLLGWSVTDEQRAAAIEAATSFHDYLGALLDERSACPADDLLSALLAAEEEGERLSRPELLSLVATLYSAGHRTTRDLTTNGLSVLLTRRDLWDALVARPASVPRYVSEFLRYEPPTLFIARYLTDDTDVGDAVIPAMTPIIVALAAGNRDPEAYPEPDEFRPERWAPDAEAPPPALSFAFGPHFCLGASLARTEGEVMLSTIVDCWPGLRRAPDATLEFRQRGPFRQLSALLVDAA